MSLLPASTRVGRASLVITLFRPKWTPRRLTGGPGSFGAGDSAAAVIVLVNYPEVPNKRFPPLSLTRELVVLIRIV